VVFVMLLGLSLDYIARGCTLANYNLSWELLKPPVTTTYTAVGKVWEYQLTLSTFILTFFLSHAFQYWNKVYSTTRIIQGRINDFCMLLTMGAERGASL